MRRAFEDYTTFWREFHRSFHHTGALLPSGAQLARAIASPLANRTNDSARILEIGPGTGALTHRIIDQMTVQDTLDLVELNDQFVCLLQEKKEHHPAFQPIGDRMRILHAAVQDLPLEQPYDFIISGLPLNNFQPSTVRTILRHIKKLLAPGGRLSFFEYLWIRSLKGTLAPRREKWRLRQIDRVLRTFMKAHETRDQVIFLNVPPAVVHHLSFDATLRSNLS